MHFSSAHPRETSDEDQPRGGVCKGEKGKCREGRDEKLEKVKEDRECRGCLRQEKTQGEEAEDWNVVNC